MKQKGDLGLNKEWLGKLFRRDNLIILVLSGVLLFIIALPTKKTEISEEEHQSQEKVENQGLDFAGGGTGGVKVYNNEYDYTLYLEERLEKILSGASGVGEVSVMITLESSEELIVEKDRLQSYSDIKETDAQGGERITSQTDRQESTVYITEGSDNDPYVIMRMLPRVEGVLVVAGGAGNGTVKKNITEIVQALFDVEVHKIKVVKMAVSD